MRTAILLIAIACSACTAGMHHTYQRIVAGVGTSANLCSFNATRVSLRDNPRIEETNWVMGLHPSTPTLVGSTVFNAAVMGGLLYLPELVGSPRRDAPLDTVGELMIDVLVTGMAAAEVGWAMNDSMMNGRTCGL